VPPGRQRTARPEPARHRGLPVSHRCPGADQRCKLAGMITLHGRASRRGTAPDEADARLVTAGHVWPARAGQPAWHGAQTQGGRASRDCWTRLACTGAPWEPGCPGQRSRDWQARRRIGHAGRMRTRPDPGCHGSVARDADGAGSPRQRGQGPPTARARHGSVARDRRRRGLATAARPGPPSGARARHGSAAGTAVRGAGSPRQRGRDRRPGRGLATAARPGPPSGARARHGSAAGTAVRGRARTAARPGPPSGARARHGSVARDPRRRVGTLSLTQPRTEEGDATRAGRPARG